MILVWYGTTSEVPWLFLLAAWVFAAIGVAFAYELWNRRGLRPVIEVENATPGPQSPADLLPDHLFRNSPWPAPVFEGDELVCELGLDVSGHARGPAWIEGTLGGDAVREATVVVSAEGWRTQRSVRHVPRGPLDASGWRVGTTDLLGLVKSERPWPDGEVALVLPLFASLTSERQPHEREAQLVAPRAGSGTEPYGVRDFIPGDPLRRIHWRSSARRGSLVVREYEPPSAGSIALLLDPEPRRPEVADQIARIAASEAWDAMRDQANVVLWAPGLEPITTGRPDSFWQVLAWLARYPSCPAGEAYQPRGVSDAVAIVGGAATEVFDALEGAASRGAVIRTWVVGDAQVNAPGEVRRVGLSWPVEA